MRGQTQPNLSDPGTPSKTTAPVGRHVKRPAVAESGCLAIYGRSLDEQGAIGSDVSSWCKRYANELAIADEVLSRKLADARSGLFTNVALVDEIFNNILMSNMKSSSGKTLAIGDGMAEEAAVSNSSVLLLGEAGTGKTHAIEYCLTRLRDAISTENTLVLRAFGGAYATDVECVRHLAAQVRGGSLSELEADLPSRNASFETGMDWIRGVLREGFRHTSFVVMVLEKFEHFCSKARQTLLYNLFDIAQESGVCISIIGTSEKMDVMDLLEKRIKSRFSMRYLHAFRPKTMDDLFVILLEKLRLPTNDHRLTVPFVKEFHGKLEKTLSLQKSNWLPHFDAGMPPSWFLWKCLPVARFIREADENSFSSQVVHPELQAKRQKTATQDPISSDFLASFTRQEMQSVLVRALSEDQHMVMLALHRLQVRQSAQTLAVVLLELLMFHEDRPSLTRYSEDRYSFAFEALEQAGLIEVASPSAGDPPRRYMACHSCAQRLYTALVGELADDASATRLMGSTENPLRCLPEPVRQWATEQLRRNS